MFLSLTISFLLEYLLAGTTDTVHAYTALQPSQPLPFSVAKDTKSLLFSVARTQFIHKNSTKHEESDVTFSIRLRLRMALCWGTLQPEHYKNERTGCMSNSRMVLQFTASPFILTNRQLLLGGNIISLVTPQQSTTQRKKHDLLKWSQQSTSLGHKKEGNYGEFTAGMPWFSTFIVSSSVQDALTTNPEHKLSNLILLKGPFCFVKRSLLLLNQDK